MCYTALMRCPRCGKDQPESRDCVQCGIVIAKYLARQDGAGPEPLAAPAPPPRPKSAFEAVAEEESSKYLKVLDFVVPPAGARLHFYTSMARLVDSGIPLTEAVRTVEVSGTGRLQVLARRGRIGLEQGEALSTALTKGRSLLPPVHAAILEAGERTGHLGPALRQLASMQEESRMQARKLAGNLAYPLVVVFFSCFLLPLPVLVLGSGTAYAKAVAGKLVAMLAGLALAWLAVRFVSVTGTGLLARMPARLERSLLPGRRSTFFLVLKNAMQSGLPITETLVLAAKVWGSRSARSFLEDGVQGLERGETLTTVLAPLVEQGHVVLLASGEKSGKLEETFAQLHEIYATKAASRRRVVFIVASVLISIGLFAYMASQLLGSYQQAMEGPGQELERELNRELRGIWNRG